MERRLATIFNHLAASGSVHTVFEHSTILPNETCGIIAYVGNAEGEAWDVLIDGLTILENRGYDSAGVCTLDGSKNQLVVSKFASSQQHADAITRLKKHKSPHTGHKIGIAHTRWATHGGKTDRNAHPHTDHRERIALVHNGVITNADEIRKELESKGIQFRSETDTEVIAQLIGSELDKNPNVLEAIKSAEAKLEGTWGVVLISKDKPDELYAFKNGSPLLVGIAKGKMFVASEPSAFGQHTKEYIALENGEIAVIKPDTHTFNLARVELAPNEHIETNPYPFEHWTLKEIMEQPQAISRSLNYGGRFKDEISVKLGGLDSNKSILQTINHLVICACGTSYHAGLMGAYYMRTLNSFETVQVVDAAEMTMDMIPKKGGGLLVLSQSGETKDVHRCVVMAQQFNVPVFSIVNVVGSLIARTTKIGVYLNVGREHAVASTKAFTGQVVALALVSVWFSQIKGTEESRRKSAIEGLHRLPISIGMALNVRETCRRVAALLSKATSCFVLGKGLAEPIAREGALKIKEISYIHAEGTSGGALKHGPFALIDQGTPIILIILDDQHAHLMRTAAEEVRARGAKTIVITNEPKLATKIADEVIKIPSNNGMTALLSVIPLQFIAYELALLRGLNPDKPRNLAKAVTVD